MATTPSVAHIDFETRSILDLRAVGLWNYARSPMTAVWCMAYAVGDEEPRLWLPGDAFPQELASGIIVAHNAPFELEIWNNILAPRWGWPTLDVERLYCTMAQCYAMGLPGGLEDAALALGLHVLKDTEGRNLMLRMARPRNPKQVANGFPPMWWDDDDEKLARLYAYCKQDVRVERELHTRLLPLSDIERKVWLLDRKINNRGVAVDLVTAQAGSQLTAQMAELAGQQLNDITGGAVQSPTALIALKQWCGAQGYPVESLDKPSLEQYLTDPAIPPQVKAALQVRQEAGKASLAKLDKMQLLAGDDGRIHHWAQYHGAGTGRWAARGVQPHNLVRDMPPAPIVDEILSAVRAGEIEWIKLAYGPPMDMLSRCMRSLFVASTGRVLIPGDFSNVEGRGTAWHTGEEWKLEAFRRADLKRGPGVYEMTAHKTLGVPLEKITKKSPERQIGKIQELAFGYQGGVGAARRFLPAHMKDTPDKILNEWKLAWRAAHPMIVQGWADLENAAIAAVHSPGKPFMAGMLGRHVTFKKAGSFLWCKLPSGRVLCYPYPKLLAGQWKDQLTYVTVPGEADHIVKDAKNANNWARVSTYGGALMENIIQAICRDLLAFKMLELDSMGAAIVLHVHDEIVIEVNEQGAEKAAAVMQQRLRTAPDWASDFPLWADCEPMKRYGKGD